MQDVPTADATLHLAASGDQAAFARLVSQHHASMTRVAFAICRDAEVASDAVRSAWTIAWHRLRDVKDPAAARAWLVAIAANEARRAMRRMRRLSVVDLSAAFAAQGAGDPADSIATADLARALRSLGADDQALLAVRFVAGLDSAEIAAQLGGTASGVESRLTRLMDRLRLDLDYHDKSWR